MRPTGLLIAVFGVLTTVSAWAADNPPAVVTKGVVTIEAALAPDSKAPIAGGTCTVQVTIELEPGWHVYANPAGVESFRPTVVELDKGTALTLERVKYSPGKPTPALDGSGDTSFLYETEAEITAELKIPANTPPGTLTVPLQVKYQTCNDSYCLPPATLSVPMKLTVAAQ